MVILMILFVIGFVFAMVMLIKAKHVDTAKEELFYETAGMSVFMIELFMLIIFIMFMISY